MQAITGGSYLEDDPQQKIQEISTVSDQVVSFFNSEISDLVDGENDQLIFLYLLNQFDIDFTNDINIGETLKNGEKLITDFTLTNEGEKKIKNLLLFLEIRKQIQKDLSKELPIISGVEKYIGLYNCTIPSSGEEIDSTITEEQIDTLLQNDSKNKFLQQIKKKILENKVKNENLNKYKYQLKDLQKNYNLELFFNKFSGELTPEYKKSFGQLYSNAIDEVRTTKLSFSYTELKDNTDFIEIKKEEKFQKQQERQKKLDQEQAEKDNNEYKKRKKDNFIKGALLASLMTIAGYGIINTSDTDTNTTYNKLDTKELQNNLHNKIQMKLHKEITEYIENFMQKSDNIKGITGLLGVNITPIISAHLYMYPGQIDVKINQDIVSVNLAISYKYNPEHDFIIQVPIADRFKEQYPYSEDYEIN